MYSSRMNQPMPTNLSVATVPRLEDYWRRWFFFAAENLPGGDHRDTSTPVLTNWLRVADAVLETLKDAQG